MALRRTSSRLVWKNVTLGPADPILGLTQAYQADSDPSKVNLGVGAYRDDNGKPFVLECVKEAKQRLLASSVDHEYAGIVGVAPFVSAAQKLLLGDESKALAENRVASLQTLSGTGALRVAGDFLARFYPSKTIYLPNPTWGNHNPIFEDAGLELASYRYYRKSDCGLDLAGMCEDLKAAPAGSIVLLHACAHNPTGVDPTTEEWGKILEVIQERNHFAFIDSAYQGFATGDIVRDATAVRMFEASGVPMLVSQSFAKNFGLYGERAGALHFVCGDKDECERVMSQVKILVRPMYSNPPINGARLVAEVLNDKDLVDLWQKDVTKMSERIIKMRHELVDDLKAAGSTKDWSHVTNQIGMFSFTGMNKEQCDRMIKEFHVYLTGNGRISVAGLTSHNVAHVARAMHEVTKA